jgi:hypothetical protein
MPSAQTERAEKGFVFTNKASQAGDIATLRANIQAGKIIYRSDINAIVTLINNMLGHYHTYADYKQAATYGAGYGDNPGSGDRTLYTADQNTGTPTNFPSALGAVPAGATVSAAAINVGLQAIRALGSHKHPMVDQTTNP